MKFSSNTNALSLLIEGSAPLYSTADNNQQTHLAAKFMQTKFPAMRDGFRQKIQYLSNSFYTSFLKGKHKLIEVLWDETIEQSGTFISPISEGGTSTLFYRIKTTPATDHKWRIECILLMFNKTKRMPEPYLVSYLNMLNDQSQCYIHYDMASDGISKESLIAELLALITFTKYCDLETTVVNAGKKQVHLGEKYLNESMLPIEILDSTWFTTIVRSEGFTVGGDSGGFFRLQPYGPGRLQKKWIWIAPFEKSGYVRKAKMLQANKEA